MNKPLLLIYFQTIFLPVSEGLYVDLARGPVESNPADIFELRMPRLSHWPDVCYPASFLWSLAWLISDQLFSFAFEWQDADM